MDKYLTFVVLCNVFFLFHFGILPTPTCLLFIYTSSLVRLLSVHLDSICSFSVSNFLILLFSLCAKHFSCFNLEIFLSFFFLSYYSFSLFCFLLLSYFFFPIGNFPIFVFMFSSFKHLFCISLIYIRCHSLILSLLLIPFSLFRFRLLSSFSFFLSY